MPAYAWDSREWQTPAEEVAKKLAGQIKGKTVLVTGVSPNSLGQSLLLTIAPYSPKLLILASRTPSNLEACQDELNKANPNVQTKLLRLDLSDFDQVREAAAELMSWDDVPRIDVLCNNAGIAPGADKRRMINGIESTFATNHLGHFLFTKGVLPKVKKAAEEQGHARIVNVSSKGHFYGPVRFDNYNFDNEDWSPMAAYSQSKTAAILFSVSLADKLKSKGIAAFSLHPGSIFTGLVRNMSTAEMVERGWADQDRRPTDSTKMHWKTMSQGTSTHVVSCFDPSISDRSGSYLQDTMIETEDVKDYALNRENAEKLWRLSEELVGERFEV